MEELFYTIDEKYLCAADEVYSGNFAKGKVLLEQILEEEPGYAKAHFLLGRICFHELGEFRRAEDHFRLAIQFNPELPWTYHAYLQLLIFLNEKEKALQLVERALKINGICEACILNEKGLILERDKAFKEAALTYKRAIYLALDSCNETDFNNNLQRAERKLRGLKAYQYVT